MTIFADPSSPGATVTAPGAGSAALSTLAPPVRPVPYPLLPLFLDENGEPITQHPDDLKYGNLLIGGQGSGKTSVLLRMFLNAVRDPRRAVVLFDPKSELTDVALGHIPPTCGKPVYVLDLAAPQFGISPLRFHATGGEELAREAAALGDKIVGAISDSAEGQVYISSERFLQHAVIGAVALAHAAGETIAHLSDVQQLLLPTGDILRSQAASACAAIPGMGQTAEFFHSVMPAMLDGAKSATYQKIDPPENKLSRLMLVASLREFFNHPRDIPMREIIEGRGVLIVKASMGAVGDKNARMCLQFILRELNQQLHRHMAMPPEQRPLVSLIVDEASVIVSSPNVVDQIATHRANGLDVTFALQFFAQLGADSELHAEKIRKGVINLLQSRFLFRLGDPTDAEEMTRIAMAVYMSLLRDDPDSRARMRVPAEYGLVIAIWHLIVSAIINGSRASAFAAKTFPFSAGRDDWRREVLAIFAELLAARPGYAGRSDTYYTRVQSRRGVYAARLSKEPPKPDEGEDPDAAPADVGSDAPVAPPARVVASPVLTPGADPLRDRRDGALRVMGFTPQEPWPERKPDGEFDARLRALAISEGVIRYGRAAEPAATRDVARWKRHPRDLRVLKALDCFGPTLSTLLRPIARGVDGTDDTASSVLERLRAYGLISSHSISAENEEATKLAGKPPRILYLTKLGLDALKECGEVAAGRRFIEWNGGQRHSHDQHTVAAFQALSLFCDPGSQRAPRIERYFTPRYEASKFIPRRGKRKITEGDFAAAIPSPTMVHNMPRGLDEIRTDLLISFKVDSPDFGTQRFEVAIEVDCSKRNKYNESKLYAYDGLLSGWIAALERKGQPRVTPLSADGRPAVLFVCASAQHALSLARYADDILDIGIGAMGAAPEDRIYWGRRLIFFMGEEDLHRGVMRGYALHPLPPEARLPEDAAVRSVEVFPPSWGDHRHLRTFVGPQLQDHAPAAEDPEDLEAAEDAVAAMPDAEMPASPADATDATDVAVAAAADTPGTPPQPAPPPATAG